MDKNNILQLAYLGECLPGLIHNIGNPLGALLGFVAILKEEVAELQKEVDNFSETEMQEKVKNALSKIAELCEYATRCEESLGKAMEKMVVKCGRDLDTAEGEFDLNELIKIETEVLLTNGFYKHKINKQFEFVAGPFMVNARWGTFSQPIGSILFRYTKALLAVQDPALSIRTKASGNRLIIEIGANVRLSEQDLIPAGTNSLPALTIQECKDVLSHVSSIEYASEEVGSSTITLKVEPQKVVHTGERKEAAGGISERSTSSSRNASATGSL